MYKSANVLYIFLNYAYNFCPLFFFYSEFFTCTAQIIDLNLCSARTLLTIFLYYASNSSEMSNNNNIKKQPINFMAAYLFLLLLIFFAVRVKFTSPHKFCLLYLFLFCDQFIYSFQFLLHYFVIPFQ